MGNAKKPFVLIGGAIAATALLSLRIGSVLRAEAAPVVRPFPPLPSWCVGPFVKAGAANPILSPRTGSVFLDPMSGKSVAWEHDHTFNPAAVVRDGQVTVLYRAEDDSGQGIGGHTSRLGLAASDDGLQFTRFPRPVLYPDTDSQKDNEWPGGCEDPRLVETEEGGSARYVLMYTQWNRKTPRLAVASSPDLIHWTKYGPAFASAYNGRFRDLACKSGAILTKLVNGRLLAAKLQGKYWMYWGEHTVRLATSSDLVHWEPVVDTKGEPQILFAPRRGKFDSDLVEAGPPALITKRGIVVLYNGKNGSKNGDPAIKAGAYSGGQALFDVRGPSHLLGRTENCFITPEAPYEASGQYAAGTVFIEGLTYFRGKWLLYYGTADSHVAVAVANADAVTLPNQQKKP